MRAYVARIVAGCAMILLLAAAVVIAQMSNARVWIERLAGYAEAVPAPHWMAFVTLQVVVAAVGFLPASLMAIAAGAAYGMAAGTLISVAGTMAGGWVAFLLSRSMLRPWIARLVARYPASARFEDAIATEGWKFVCLMRLSPVMPFAATSYGLGLTRIGQRDYLLGTLASLPALVGYVAVGAFGRAGLAISRGAFEPLQWLLPLAGVAVVLLALFRLRRLTR